MGQIKTAKKSSNLENMKFYLYVQKRIKVFLLLIRSSGESGDNGVNFTVEVAPAKW